MSDGHSRSPGQVSSGVSAEIWEPLTQCDVKAACCNKAGARGAIKATSLEKENFRLRMRARSRVTGTECIQGRPFYCSEK